MDLLSRNRMIITPVLGKSYLFKGGSQFEKKSMSTNREGSGVSAAR